ncbi:MAG: T9SS type A sorting domain-containing protein [Flavobacteriales bacterium]|nr:T9SS type A sorting domain-containing protein [Flavobacteriales bacterium]MCB9204900.1 T9SS type A sorting domain-containing protein [Flavobacteriales bacterium]
MEVYPNPSNGEFVVEIRGVEADVQLNVLDLAGRVVYTEGAVLNGDFRRSMNLDVATGTYLLQIATEEGLVTRKIQIH